MSNQIPSHLNGSNVVIKIGNADIAFAGNLQISDSMNLSPVSGIGSASPHTLEPLQYIARGSIGIQTYSDAVLSQVSNGGTNPSAVPGALAGTGTTQNADGNSLLKAQFFSPVYLLSQASFDIDIYEKLAGSNGIFDRAAENELNIVYRLRNCRMANYSMNFSAGGRVQENVSFLAISFHDVQSEEESKSSIG